MPSLHRLHINLNTCHRVVPFFLSFTILFWNWLLKLFSDNFYQLVIIFKVYLPNERLSIRMFIIMFICLSIIKHNAPFPNIITRNPFFSVNFNWLNFFRIQERNETTVDCKSMDTRVWNINIKLTKWLKTNLIIP